MLEASEASVRAMSGGRTARDDEGGGCKREEERGSET